MPVVILSLDFDGCICPELTGLTTTQNQLPAKDLLEKYNETLINFIIIHLRPYNTDARSKLEVVTGSTRQGMSSDYVNIEHKKDFQKPWSVFRAIEAMTEIFHARLQSENLSKIEAKLNKLSIHDLFCGDPKGKTFDDALALSSEQTWEYSKPVDKPTEREKQNFINISDDKILLLYGQIHQAAQDHPNEEIVIKFFDDNADILHKLKRFFAEKNGEWLIPQNVTLELYQYSPCSQITTPKLIANPKGKGNTDYDITQTFNDVRNELNVQPKFDSKEGQRYKASLIAKRGGPQESSLLYSTKKKQDNQEKQLRSLDEKIAALGNKAVNLYSRGFIDESNKALSLHNSLKDLVQEYKQSNDLKKLQECKTKLNSEDFARLKELRSGKSGSKEVINKKNFSFFCCGLFKFESDTHKKIKAIQKALDAIRENEHKKASSNNSPSAS